MPIPPKTSRPPTMSQGGPTLISNPRRSTRMTRRQAVLNAPNREDGTAPSSEWGECSRFRKTTRTEQRVQGFVTQMYTCHLALADTHGKIDRSYVFTYIAYIGQR